MAEKKTKWRRNLPGDKMADEEETFPSNKMADNNLGLEASLRKK